MNYEDELFRPDEAELRDDESVCRQCRYTHFFLIDCPNCHPKTTEKYNQLSGA